MFVSIELNFLSNRFNATQKAQVGSQVCCGKQKLTKGSGEVSPVDKFARRRVVSGSRKPQAVSSEKCVQI